MSSSIFNYQNSYYDKAKMYNNYKINNFNIINLNKFKNNLHITNNKYKLSR